MRAPSVVCLPLSLSLSFSSVRFLRVSVQVAGTPPPLARTPHVPNPGLALAPPLSTCHTPAGRVSHPSRVSPSRTGLSFQPPPPSLLLGSRGCPRNFSCPRPPQAPAPSPSNPPSIPESSSTLQLPTGPWAVGGWPHATTVPCWVMVCSWVTLPRHAAGCFACAHQPQPGLVPLTSIPLPICRRLVAPLLLLAPDLFCRLLRMLVLTLSPRLPD